MNRIRNASRIVRIASALGLLLALVLLAACSSPAAAPAPDAGEKPASSAAPETPPTLKLVTPADGAELPAGNVDVAVETTDLKFVMPSNTNVPGEGHVHFTLDDLPFEMSIEPAYTFENVEPGEHKLVAELVQNNTQSFDPPIKQEITFVVK